MMPQVKNELYRAIPTFFIKKSFFFKLPAGELHPGQW